MRKVDNFKLETNGNAISATVFDEDAAPGVTVNAVLVPRDGDWIIEKMTFWGDPTYWLRRGQQPRLALTDRSLAALRPTLVRRSILGYATFERIAEPEVVQFLRDHQDPAVAELLGKAPIQVEPKRGRRPLPEREVRDIAELALRFAFEGGGSVRRRVAEALPGELTLANVRDRIKKARDRGYLAPVDKPGVTDFRPGPLLEETWEREGYPEWHPRYLAAPDNQDQGKDQ